MQLIQLKTAIQFTAIFPRESYFGIGIGNKMTSAELIMFLAPKNES